MIELKQVTKQYGQAAVLKNITLSIDEPGIYCLLGRNGAGKTTLLKSVAGYQNITSGTIQVDGKVITTSTLDTGVSYIENFAKHFNLPVRKLLQIASEVNPDYDYDFASEMMERFELDGKKKFNHLSLGMKTMVSTIISLASNKSVVILDEPVLGFDAIMRVEFYDIGQDLIQRELDRLQYGNCDISDWEGRLNTNNSNRALTGFWIESSLLISPVEQVEVMERIFGDNSAYSEKTQAELKQVMLLPEIDSTDISIYGKTGMGKANGIVVDAWFTGFAESTTGKIYFCVRLGRNDGMNVSSSLAKEIAIKIVSDYCAGAK